MKELNFRTNIQCFEMAQKPVVLYEDHRSILFALWHAKWVAELLTKPHTLVTFDLHDDLRTPSSDVRKKALNFRNGGDEREFYSFVEWEVGALDDDWVIIAMDLGLVGDVINVGAGDEEGGNLADPFVSIPDISETETSHRVWKLDHLWNALAARGALRDIARRDTLEPLWKTIGWDPEKLIFENNVSIILDFDLDCFSIKGPDDCCRIAWPPEIMIDLFERESDCGLSSTQFIRRLRDESTIVTIAKESPYCGGTWQSEVILDTLSRILFDDRLR
ncbi:MAG: hypothetical protein R3B09_26330 [Nannocystaceae bacterium]